ncbi:MAG TPA: hydrogenase maturation protease [Dehalococcoidia bacterium]|nr:hydrogenase maturation protease [Dehalococcoidia bacterium]
MSNQSTVFGSRPPPGTEEAPPHAEARVLCLGNELLADDALGPTVAAALQRLALPSVEIECTEQTGFNLLDHILSTRRLVVVDTILTGKFKPGSILCLRETDVESVFGSSPHYIGLFEALAVARRLQLPVPAVVDIVAVEGADCTTVGGPMHPAVRLAIPATVNLVVSLLKERQRMRPALDSGFAHRARSRPLETEDVTEQAEGEGPCGNRLSGPG